MAVRHDDEQLAPPAESPDTRLPLPAHPPSSPPPTPPLLQRVAVHWVAVDVLIALFLLALSLSKLLVARSDAGGLHRLVSMGVAIGCTVPIAFRRRRPIVALAAIAASTAVGFAGGVAHAPPLIGFAAYSVAVGRDRRVSLSALGLVEALLAAVALVDVVRGPGRGDVTVVMVVALAAWFVGDSVRARRTYVAGLADQERNRQQEEVERAHRSVAEERLRIARELHDVVAHSLSVIAVQSGVGRHVALSQPEEARKALAAVEETSRSALDELRVVLGSLRRDGAAEAPALVPEPGVADLPQLVEQVRSAGIPVEFSARGQLDRLSRSQALSVYRIVQEALTNVVKHAGPARASVDVVHDGDTVTVEVVDDGRGPPAPVGGPAPGGRHGIVGMRERVGTFRGTLETGARPGGGFRVLARMPAHRGTE